jgi:hypothetical protein
LEKNKTLQRNDDFSVHREELFEILSSLFSYRKDKLKRKIGGIENMLLTEQFINKLIHDIVTRREVPIRASRFIIGKIGNDDDPNTTLIRDRCACNQADLSGLEK